MVSSMERRLRRLYRALQRPIQFRFFCRSFRFHIIKPTEERIKRHCLDRLLDIWEDHKKRGNKTSSIVLAIEASEVLLPYLEFKYPSSDNISWQQYFEECTNIRLFLLTELIKMGHGQYINDTNRFGNTPLIFSCALKEPRLVRFLLDHGAVITQPFRCKYCNPTRSEARHDRDQGRDDANNNNEDDQQSLDIESNESQSLLMPSSQSTDSIYSSADTKSSVNTNSSLFCRHHLTQPKERFDMIGQCGRMKKEYSRLAQFATGRVPASFFASKAHVIDELLDMINTELDARRRRLQKCINETRWIPEALAPMIVEYVPL